MYRELILNSEEYTRGDKNHPRFLFPENVSLDKFCVRNVQVPNFLLNVPRRNYLRIRCHDVSGVVTETTGAPIFPRNINSVAELVGVLNPILAALGGGTGSFGVNNEFWLQLDTLIAGCSFFSFEYSGDDGLEAKHLRRLLGDIESVLESKPYANQINTPLVGALKMTQNNYLLLKSNAMAGANFTPNTRVGGAYQTVSTLAKIPLNFSSNPYGQYVFYDVNDAPSPETMFSFNGHQLNEFDLYFTRPHDTDVVDFQGWNFGVTLGIITNEAP
jgi:hypothetical protein